MKKFLILIAAAGFLTLAPIMSFADVITVNTLDDDGNGLDGDCNLREAVLAANGNIGADNCDPGSGADEIVFAAGLSGTISLQSALPAVTDSLTITGPGADALTLDGGQFESTLRFNSTTNDQVFSVSGLTVTNGRGEGGGGIYAGVGETLTVSRCRILRNFADGKSRGGGIGAEGSTLTLVDSTVSDNESNSLGGGVASYNSGAKATLRNSTISGNRALEVGDGVNAGAGAGGGIYCDECDMDIVNSTISGNAADLQGGGLFNVSTVRLRNVTVTGNAAGADGGGVFNEGGANVFLRNSIIAGNEDEGGETPDCAGALSSQDYNLFGSTDGCTLLASTAHNLLGDALLGLLSDNGGPTFTHELLSGSPALDAGDPAGCIDENGDPLTADQRGFERPVGSACDIGALEVGGCGDGAVDAAKGEACDDGNGDDSDDCRNDCTLPAAGTTGGTTGGATAGGDTGGSAGGGCSLIR